MESSIGIIIGVATFITAIIGVFLNLWFPVWRERRKSSPQGYFEMDLMKVVTVTQRGVIFKGSGDMVPFIALKFALDAHTRTIHKSHLEVSQDYWPALESLREKGLIQKSEDESDQYILASGGQRYITKHATRIQRRKVVSYSASQTTTRSWRNPRSWIKARPEKEDYYGYFRDEHAGELERRSEPHCVWVDSIYPKRLERQEEGVAFAHKMVEHSSDHALADKVMIAGFLDACMATELTKQGGSVDLKLCEPPLYVNEGRTLFIDLRVVHYRRIGDIDHLWLDTESGLVWIGGGEEYAEAKRQYESSRVEAESLIRRVAYGEVD